MMAVAMEVGWRAELGYMKHKAGPAATNTTSSSLPSWGVADPQKVLQLMMGRIDGNRPTLDLFGSSGVENSPPDEFVELDPDLPLPSGWEKCLDLKSGKVYYVNRMTGMETYNDPRQQRQQQAMANPEEPSVAPQTRDFLGSKESEKERLIGDYLCRPSFSGREESGRREQWGHPGWFGESSRMDNGALELKLNLQAKTQQNSVCTLEKVEMALMRSENSKMLGKRVANGSVSEPVEQLMRSPAAAAATPQARVSPSPSTSSSSATSSRPSDSLVSYQLLDKENQNSNKRPSAVAAAAAATAAEAPVVTETDGESVREMVAVGGCKNCLMFVMLSKSNPLCPRCGASVAVDFSSPPSSKRTKFERE